MKYLRLMVIITVYAGIVYVFGMQSISYSIHESYPVIEDTLTLQLVYTLNIVQVKGQPELFETWYKE